MVNCPSLKEAMPFVEELLWHDDKKVWLIELIYECSN
jgi:hypothetical protein